MGKQGKIYSGSRILTKKYLAYLKSLLNTDTVESRILNNNVDACIDLYRHCLLSAYSKESTLNYAELGDISFDCAGVLRDVIEKENLADVEVDLMVQGCMHCIILAKGEVVGRGST